MASEQSQVWNSLVRAMTRKIELPRVGAPEGGPRYVTAADLAPPPPPPPSASTAGRDADSSPGTAGRRRSDPPVPSAAPAGTASPDAAIERIAAQLSHLPRQTLDRWLERHGAADGPLLRRMAAMGLVAAADSKRMDWWTALSRGATEPETVAELMRSAPGIPRHRPGHGLMFDWLLDAAAVGSYRDVRAADQRSIEEGREILDLLVESGAITEGRAADLTAEFHGLRRARGRALQADVSMASTITPELAEAFSVVPVADDGGGSALTLVSASDPGPALLESLGQLTGRSVQVLVDTPTNVRQLLRDWEKAVAEARRAVQQKPAGRGGGHGGRGRSSARNEHFRLDQDSFAGINSPPDMARLLMERATAIHATDIHLEPQQGRMRVRFRVDGIMHDVTQMRGTFGEEVLSRVKVMADMDITERRRPQDGHIHIELLGEPFDFRIATVPTSQGERMSVRITASSREVPRLDHLGLEDAELRRMHDFTRRSHGIVLSCGPVGAGKTTTLYACLGEIDGTAKNIMSVEDPVEIELPNVSQVHVNYKIGMDFSQGLRALLRQDPNIILVGEIRDEETAKVALRGSLTGLLVFSTIHANSAAGAVTTLYNFNIPPFLLATSLVGVVAQRLVRTICSQCRESYQPEAGQLAQAGLQDPSPDLLEAAGVPLGGAGTAPAGLLAAAPSEEPAPGTARRAARRKKAPPSASAAAAVAAGPRFWRGRGCDACFGTGYSGRTGIFEILDVTEEMRHAISERAPEASIRELAQKGGMQTLAARGRVRVLRGETTVEEFIRVLYQ
jgi:type II secretory ATPase GspE/PulE/Tfp pilus assembly ATPase PilB-like protein